MPRRHFILTILLTAGMTLTPGCLQVKQEEAASGQAIRIPGEFEEQNSVWLGFKTSESAGDVQGDSLTRLIAETLSRFITVRLVVEHDSLIPGGKSYFDSFNIDTSNIELVYMSPADIWFRDPGPVFGLTPSNELAVADFRYTGYANVPPAKVAPWARAHEGIDRNIAGMLGLATVSSAVAMEGGSFESNGKGTVIQVENVTLRRNPHLNRDGIEADFRRHFGITNVIWLPEGLASDPLNFRQITGNVFGFASGGHTDEFVRFANDSVILLAWVPEEENDLHPVNRMNHDILSKNFKLLKKSNDQDGKPFTVIRVPHPSAVTYNQVIDSTWYRVSYLTERKDKYNLKLGDTIQMVSSSSYLNYIISNGVILLPQYETDSTPASVREKDQRVRAQFEALFPGRQIIGIDPSYFNKGGGGMHCRSVTEPKSIYKVASQPSANNKGTL